MSKVEYVIYCRKSTDESSGQQTQSIPDQIKRCIEYAKANDLSIQQKPLDFSDFETEREISLEDSDKEEQNREVYKNTRHLFIVKEQQSGKTPFIRQKWRKLIKMIEKGEIQGLLSYSPDRQARNIVEGGELINLVDE
jgi:DNA invertase Pin-like site-specific DNA recombinase